MTLRTLDIIWRMRALRVLPMFFLPALSYAFYYGLSSFTKYCDRRDQQNLEKVRTERQAKIDELNERTNYYITQQLIKKYDPDPAAKAAAASVLASKLGADSGLKVFLWELNEFLNPCSCNMETISCNVRDSSVYLFRDFGEMSYLGFGHWDQLFVKKTDV